MYIEIIHDNLGNIIGCYCADTMPVKNGEKFVTWELDETVDGKLTSRKTRVLPQGVGQVRINIDTLTTMEVEEACERQARTSPDTGQPEIVELDRAEYIRENFRVDLDRDHAQGKALRTMPPGMAMRGLVRKP